MFMRSCVLVAAACLHVPAAADTQSQPPEPAAPDDLPLEPPLPHPEPAPIAMTTGVLGDWGGLRSGLHDRGIDLQLGYVSEMASNADGGAKRATTETGQFYLGATLDMAKISGLDGGKFQVIVTRRRGKNLVEVADLGTTQLVQEVYGRGNILRLTSLWYEQSFAGGKFLLKAGRLTGNTEFGTFACDFQNLGLCSAPPGNLPFSYDYFYSYPISQWAATARMRVGKKGYLQVGVYLSNPENADPKHGFRLGFKGTTGILVPVELGLPVDLDGDRPGFYKFGAIVETSRANDLVYDASGRPTAISGQPGRALRGRYGGYFLFEQQLTPSPTGLNKKGLSVFLNLTFLDRRTNLIDNQIAAGLTLTGAIQSRPADQIAFGIARNHVNNRIADVDAFLAQTDPTVERRRAEYAMEVDYRIAVVNGLRVTPNVQYIVDPGGRSRLPNVVLIGLKSAISF